ncbi:MAG: transcription antitermination factor NusB [Candidatus Aminicenantes bacterium RBG_16_63_16]|nr:MAG: transcription antitermination factor NusB [Candidatus Aminicenantes bacterium RBG_16_63_16]
MGERRRAREAALQILYQLEFGTAEPEPAIRSYWKSKRAPEATREYSRWLVKGILEHRDELDAAIQKISKHWRIARMGLVDRNILRLAAFELSQARPTAPAIVINEAIEIAKKYSSPEAAVFVNGILDALRRGTQAANPAEREEDHAGPHPPQGKARPRRRTEED